MKNNHARTLSFIMVGLGLVLIAVGVYEIVRPDEFRSKARIVLQLGDYIGLGENGVEHREYHPESANAEMKAVTSDSILSEVVYRLALREKWAIKYFNEDRISDAQAVSRIRDRLKVVQVPNTKLADISFESDDANEAALIANTVAEAYQDWRMERARRLTQGGIAALKEQLKIEDGKIKAAQDELDRLQRVFNIPDAEVAGDSVRTNFPAYWKARKNLEELNDLRDLITRKMNIEEVDLRIPYHPQVIIIERAVPSKTPVGYHWRRGRTLAVLGLALFGYGLASIWKTRPLNHHNSPV